MTENILKQPVAFPQKWEERTDKTVQSFTFFEKTQEKFENYINLQSNFICNI